MAVPGEKVKLNIKDNEHLQDFNVTILMYGIPVIITKISNESPISITSIIVFLELDLIMVPESAIPILWKIKLEPEPDWTRFQAVLVFVLVPNHKF